MIVMILVSCQSSISQSINLERIAIDSDSEEFGYYFFSSPKGRKPVGTLVLLPGFGQGPESVIMDTDFDELATEQGLALLIYSGRMRMSADPVFIQHFEQVLDHAISEHSLDPENFILGGFSNGGRIALRYTELCHEDPKKHPILPRAVFMADSPIDMFLSWQLSEEILQGNLSEIAANEARWVKNIYEEYYGGTPSTSPEVFENLSPFSIDPVSAPHEIHLKNVAVRAYHDIDVSWRIVNRNQTPKYDNYIGTAELINRLRMMGNSEAEFIQTFQTGYRSDGRRHPHSWSIIDEKECLDWILTLLTKDADQ